MDLLGVVQTETWVLKDGALTSHQFILQPAVGVVGGLTAIAESWVDAWRCCFEIELGQEISFLMHNFLSDELVIKPFPFISCSILLKVCSHTVLLPFYCNE